MKKHIECCSTHCRPTDGLWIILTEASLTSQLDKISSLWGAPISGLHFLSKPSSIHGRLSNVYCLLKWKVHLSSLSSSGNSRHTPFHEGRVAYFGAAAETVAVIEQNGRVAPSLVSTVSSLHDELLMAFWVGKYWSQGTHCSRAIGWMVEGLMISWAWLRENQPGFATSCGEMISLGLGKNRSRSEFKSISCSFTPCRIILGQSHPTSELGPHLSNGNYGFYFMWLWMRRLWIWIMQAQGI